MKGPIPKYPYHPNIKKNIGMVAGGTGLTPMLQAGVLVISRLDAALSKGLQIKRRTRADVGTVGEPTLRLG